jgi:triacylglycerol lipase
VFANPVQNITALGSDPARLELGQMAARMWTSFVADLNPNGHGGEPVLYPKILCLKPLY